MKIRRGSAFVRCIGLLVCLLLLSFNYGEPARLVRELPSQAYIGSDSESRLASIGAPFSLRYEQKQQPVSQDLAEQLHSDTPAGYTVQVDLFGLIPLKKVNFYTRDSIWVMPGGYSVGVTLYTEGALVVGLGSFETLDGTAICPAQAAGIRVGDVILGVNGTAVKDAAHLTALCNETQGAVDLQLSRDDVSIDVTIEPAADRQDGIYKMGMWVRDSTAGIGTLSFYAMDTLRYGALGHPITDVDTGTLLSVKTGEIVQSNVVGIAQGSSGLPGEIQGAFSTVSQRLGTLDTNGNMGIYGGLYAPLENPLYPDGALLAYPEEIHTGPAQILTTIDENGVQAYDCQIIRTYPQTSAAGKGMVVQITDPRLIEKTGGIVQGMSGSPIMQDGKLAGAVTHVFVNDPLRGYCIYALWMYQQTLD